MLCRNDLEDDIAAYIKERVPKAQMRTVFDVGSNVGWFTYQFGKTFRDAMFYLFEPSPPIFQEISPNLQRFSEFDIWPRVRAFPIALGHEAARSKVTVEPGVTVNCITLDDSQPTVDVEVATGDGFSAQNGISQIDYLKIDAEGYDLKVLIGFQAMLQRRDINFIQVEAGMSEMNKEHIPVAEFTAFLGQFGYRVFRIINQASGRVPYLTRADVVYINENAAERFVS
jgi:FkbM family methyltransferase